MTDEPLSNAEAELLGALVAGERALASLHGPPDHLEPGLIALLRRGYVQLVGPEGPLDPADAQRVLLGPRPDRPQAAWAKPTSADARPSAQRVEQDHPRRAAASGRRSAVHPRERHTSNRPAERQTEGARGGTMGSPTP